MPTYQHTSVVPADFATVWSFYDAIEGLEALTPEWLGGRVSRVVGPDGTVAPDEFRVGTEVHLTIQPFNCGFLPEREWVVSITDREVSDDRAAFVDAQVGDRGPFETWRHTHRFAALDGDTVLHDRITYRVPTAGDLPVMTPFLAGFLRYRHRRTRALLAE